MFNYHKIRRRIRYQLNKFRMEHCCHEWKHKPGGDEREELGMQLV